MTDRARMGLATLAAAGRDGSARAAGVPGAALQPSEPARGHAREGRARHRRCPVTRMPHRRSCRSWPTAPDPVQLEAIDALVGISARVCPRSQRRHDVQTGSWQHRLERLRGRSARRIAAHVAAATVDEPRLPRCATRTKQVRSAAAGALAVIGSPGRVGARGGDPEGAFGGHHLRACAAETSTRVRRWRVRPARYSRRRRRASVSGCHRRRADRGIERHRAPGARGGGGSARLGEGSAGRAGAPRSVRVLPRRP